MKNSVILQLQDLKIELLKDGFSILGVVGSYGRGDYTEESDVDLLYEIENPKEFTERFGGFGAFAKLEDIKNKISKSLGKDIDLIAKNSLDSFGKKYILKDLKYV